MKKPLNIKLCILFIMIATTGLTIASCEGPAGPQGPQGEQGPPGPVGPAGADGSVIHAGQGVPGETLGNPGDFYLDLGSGQLYGPRMAGGWGEPVGLGGTEGAEGPQGPPGEDGEDGQDGQDGQDGEDGADGSQIFAGNGPPDGGQGSDGDYYLDKDNYDLYGPKTGDGWGAPVNLQGPQGEQGEQGPAGTANHSDLDNLDADDHLQYLLVDGVREATDGFAVTGTFRNGNIPVEGEGTRLMWYPGKGAFRAGRVAGEQWDDANIGGYSTALGFRTTASGDISTAMGNNTTASGTSSTVMGWNTTASGNGSTAMGAFTVAASNYSLTIGRLNNTNSDVDNPDNTLFVAGNGVNGNRSDALVLDFNGNLTIAGTLTENSDRRLKKDIHPIEESALEKLGHIEPVRYQFKNQKTHPEGTQIGLIAQQVQAQFPELVSEKSDGYLNLSYSKFTTVLLKAVQEQQEQIRQQQETIQQNQQEHRKMAVLLSENRQIKQRLATLEIQMQPQQPGRASLPWTMLLIPGICLVSVLLCRKIAGTGLMGWGTGSLKRIE